MKYLDIILITLAIIALYYYLNIKKENLDLYNKDMFNDIKKAFQNPFGNINWGDIGQQIKNVFDPKGVVLDSCPPNTKEVLGDCYGLPVDREDGRNDAEPLWKANDLKWSKERGHYRDGCSWNRHQEAAVCFRACPDGYFGRAYERCWPNGADSFGVVKRLVDRGTSCPYERHTKKVGLLCYIP